ncbi:MAG: PIG-L family deacetylase [Syntrophomonadaceae bacterium]|nr:PIG-L family deacetylase [Syntrophomonadaceae bacterium]MDD3889881.1 PIG-L family deacetylase [Syntrophomonadaceae bacterium]MDD4548549.1 PIG-L family deacetylase [Syntrophomonadaceae bacterium]
MNNIMVFAPHPDDDIIGCGGSIAQHVKKGNKVSIVYMSSGDAGSLQYDKKQLAEIREQEASRAAEVLGVKDIIFLRNPDGYIDYNRDNLIQLTSIIRTKKPDTVYVPHAQDCVQDHITTHKLVVEACNRAAGPWFQECSGQPCPINNILGYEVWTPLPKVSYVEDISDFMELKIAALRMHVSQLADINYDEAIKGLNRYRGMMTRRGNYCECFEIIKIKNIGV